MRNSVETEETVRPLWQSGPRFMGNRHVCSQPSAYIQKLVEQLIAPIFLYDFDCICVGQSSNFKDLFDTVMHVSRILSGG